MGRVVDRFALVALAGELAAEWGIVPWRAGNAEWSAEVCLQAWLVQRGGIGAELGWKSVSVYHGLRHAPHVRLDAQGAALLAQVGATSIMLTLSHTDTMAMAVAALAANGHTLRAGWDAVATSSPTFEEDLRRCVS